MGKSQKPPSRRSSGVKKATSSRKAPRRKRATKRAKQSHSHRGMAFQLGRLALLVGACGFLALPFFYNSCEDISFIKTPAAEPRKRPVDPPPPPPPEPQEIAGRVTIESGKSFTRTSTLEVSFVAADASRMCFYTDAACLQDEACENFAPSKTMSNLVSLENDQGNTTLNVFVKYKHLVPNTRPGIKVENVSDCITDSIIQDTAAPTVTITAQSVASVTQESTAQVHFTPSDTGGSSPDPARISTLCRAAKADAIASASFADCTSPHSVAHTGGAGNYKFEVKAVDAAGNEGAVAEHSWCYGLGCSRRDLIATASAAPQTGPVGFLFIVDPSSRLREVRTRLSQESSDGVPRLLNAMEGLNYKVAVVPAAVYEQKYDRIKTKFKSFVDPNAPPSSSCSTPWRSENKATKLKNAFKADPIEWMGYPAAFFGAGGGLAQERWENNLGNIYVLNRSSGHNDSSLLNIQNSIKHTLACINTVWGTSLGKSFLSRLEAYQSSKNVHRSLPKLHGDFERLHTGLWFFDNLRHLSVIALTNRYDPVYQDNDNMDRLNGNPAPSVKQSVLGVISKEHAKRFKSKVELYLPPSQTSFTWHSIFDAENGHFNRQLTALTGGLKADVASPDTFASMLRRVAIHARNQVKQVQVELICDPLNYGSDDTYDPQNSQHRLVEVWDKSTPSQRLDPQPECTVDNRRVTCNACEAGQSGDITCTTPLDRTQYKFKYQCGAS